MTYLIQTPPTPHSHQGLRGDSLEPVQPVRQPLDHRAGLLGPSVRPRLHAVEGAARKALPAAVLGRAQWRVRGCAVQLYARLRPHSDQPDDVVAVLHAGQQRLGHPLLRRLLLPGGRVPVVERQAVHLSGHELDFGVRGPRGDRRDVAVPLEDQPDELALYHSARERLDYARVAGHFVSAVQARHFHQPVRGVRMCNGGNGL